MTTTLILAATLALAYFGVAGVRALGRRANFLDIPNERSSHVEPTPRGGGIVIVVISLGFYLVVTMQRPGTFSWGYFTGAVLVAVISLIDDIYTLSVIWRLLSHALAAGIVIIERGYIREVALPGGTSLQLGAAGAVITFVWIVWLINAYNFMDGIDGIAGVQAVAAAAGWMAIGWLTGSQVAFWLAGGILASTIGFLIHNWQPATVFMGDVGSAFLGFSFAVLPLLATIGEESDALLPVAGLLLVWLFLFDTVVTFFRRLFRRERVWRAHREHLYQRLVQSGWSHAKVSTLYGIIAIALTAAVFSEFANARPQVYWLPAAGLIAMVALLIVYWSRMALTRRKGEI